MHQLIIDNEYLINLLYNNYFLQSDNTLCAIRSRFVCFSYEYGSTKPQLFE